MTARESALGRLRGKGPNVHAQKFAFQVLVGSFLCKTQITRCSWYQEATSVDWPSLELEILGPKEHFPLLAREVHSPELRFRSAMFVPTFTSATRGACCAVDQVPAFRWH